MAVIHTFTCLCGAEKKSTNHWILAEATSDGISFMPWDWDMAKRNDIIVLCGERCAINLLSRSLGEWKNLPAEIPAMNSSAMASRLTRLTH